MEKTVKIPAYTGDAKSDGASGGGADELQKTITQLRESLKQEQAKSADLEAKLNRLAVLEEQQLAKKNAQLEEERKHSIELMLNIEQLRENIKQNQATSGEAAGKSLELEAKSKKIAELEAKVKELTSVLGMISRISAAGKLDSHG